jgi:hypothetical protein
VQYLQALIDESVSAMFAVVVEQIHKFAQVTICISTIHTLTQYYDYYEYDANKACSHYRYLLCKKIYQSTAT